MDSFALVVFGITGNLSQIKLIPVLYDLFDKNLLPAKFIVAGIGRKPYSKSEFRNFILEVLARKNRHHHRAIDPETADKLLRNMLYLQGDVNDKKSAKKVYSSLKKIIETNTFSNIIFYLATYPDLYDKIFKSIAHSKLNARKNGWTRLIIEKPIGRVLPSANVLDSLLRKYFSEDQIFRLDHYLGKETLQNLLIFRFNNGIFEHLMNRKHVSQIQITASEDFGIGERGRYYDSIGALRDVGQNHLLQMLALSTMDPPRQFSNEAVTAERVKILKVLKPFPDKVVFGQYNGYLYEENIDKNSQTETFFALKTEVRNSRWRGVPIYIRAGKKLVRWVTEIKIVFKVAEDRLFSKFDLGDKPNVLTYRVQPDEGIGLDVLIKRPGHKMLLNSYPMYFSYPASNLEIPDAYERLFYDAFSGDQTFFTDAQEVQEGWRFVDALLEMKRKVSLYQPDSWGPKEADELLEADGNSWIEPQSGS